MTLIAKANVHRDLGHEQLAAPEQSLGILNAAALHVAHWTLPGASAELSGEMEAAEPNDLGQIAQRQALAEILHDVFVRQSKGTATQSFG